MHLVKYEEWQGANGRWHCNDNKEMGNSIAGLWWVPARFMNIPLDDFVKLLIDKFEVDYIKMAGNVLCYSWNSQTKMRKFKNWINAEARKGNWIC